jgi:predicted HicB family RNase H-like nuclease
METKTLKIDKDLHTRIKTYCSKNMLKMNQWIERVLQDEISKVEKKDEKKNKMV